MYLNCHTYFSLRYGTMSPKELVDMAKRWGITALALTDINNTSCTVEFFNACKKAGIKPLLGIDFRAADGEQLYVGIAKNSEGFRELNQLLTDCSLSEKPLPALPPPMLNSVIVFPKLTKPISEFTDNEYLGIRPEHVNRLFTSEVRKFPEKLLVFSPVNFLNEDGFKTHQLLRCIDLNIVLGKLTRKDIAKKTEMLMPPETLLNYYAIYPKIIENTEQLIKACNVDLKISGENNRNNFTGSKEGDFSLLKKLTYNGLKRRYLTCDKILFRKAMKRTEKELTVIEELDYCTYFLITWDIVRYAHSCGYHHVGRGSGANSIVAFCIGISDVDPLELDLYFERFINRHRQHSPPDFDIDFSWDERDDVTDYIFKRYGRKHTALLATYSTFQFNAAVRELGKVYGLPKTEIDNFIDDLLRKTGTRDVRYWKEDHEGGSGGEELTGVNVRSNKSVVNKSQASTIKSQVLFFAQKIHGFPNHLSIHAGGIIISEKPLNYHTALQLMPKGFPVTHFDMYHGEEMKFHKFDILSQRGLGHVKDAVDLIKKNQGKAIDIHDISAIKKDNKVKAQLKSGECMGCFYVESPAMRGLLSKLKCEEYVHLVAASSIIRPGVAKSGMMKEYIRRFHEPDSFEYLHPVFEKHLGETFGVMVYQEDVIKILHHFADLDLGESDVLRRVMNGKKYDSEKYRKLEKKYFDNCKKIGHPDQLTNEVWRQIKSFAGYSFCKAHSASFAVESFQSLYLKAYFPLEFMVAVINNFGGFYKTEYYFHEARMAGAHIYAPCVNHSLYLTTINGKNIHIGFVHLRGMEQKAAQQIVHQRTVGGDFRSLSDFVDRVDIKSEQLEILIRVGAFRFAGKNKYKLMWEKNAVFNRKEKFENSGRLFDSQPEIFSLPDLKEEEFDQTFDEIELIGFPLRSPFELLAEPNHYDCFFAKDFPAFLGQMIDILGYYVCKKDVRTVNKKHMTFGTWLDEEGHFFDTTHFPNFLKASPFRGKGVYRIRGKVVEEYGFMSIEVVKMEQLPFRKDERYGE